MCAGPNYDAVEAVVEVTRDGRPVTTLRPQKRHFWVQQTDNSQAAISVNWARDLFVAMGDPLGAGAWSMRIQYKPLVRYIWLGALVMAIGGLIAATDRRYRVKVPVASPDTVAAPPGPRAQARYRLMWKFLLPFAAFLALVVLFAFGLNPQRDIHALAFAPDRQAGPGIHSHRCLDPSRPVSNASLKGQVYVLNVWGTWCVECRAEHQTLLAISQQHVVPIIGLDLHG